VEGAAVDGWIRGGVPVRQLVRDVNQNQWNLYFFLIWYDG
jgi:hypothetical protein